MTDEAENTNADIDSRTSKLPQVTYGLPPEHFKKLTDVARKEERSLAGQTRLWVVAKLNEISA